MNSIQIQDLIKQKTDLQSEIIYTKQQLINLEQQKTKINESLFNNCKHNWKDEGRLHHYDNVSYICLICGLEK
jgi:hypothetical protein